jgi:hypothetical protein
MGQFRWQRGKRRMERQLDELRQELSEQDATPSPPIRAPTKEELARSGPWLVWRRGQWVRDEPRHAPQRSASDDYEETGGSGHHQDRDLKMEPPKDEEVSAALDNTNVIPHNDVWNQDQLLPDDHDEHGEAMSGNPPQSRLSPQYFLPSPHLIIQQVSMATEGITLGWTSTPYLFKYPAMGDLFTGTLTYQRNGKLFDIEGLDGCFNLEAIHARSRPIHDVLCGDMSTSSNDQELLIEAGNRRLRYRVNRTDMMFLIIMDTGIPLNVRWKSLRLLDDIIQNRWTNDISGDDTRNKGCEIIQRMADFEHDTITINDGISNVGNTCFAGALMQAYARSKILADAFQTIDERMQAQDVRNRGLRELQPRWFKLKILLQRLASRADDQGKSSRAQRHRNTQVLFRSMLHDFELATGAQQNINECHQRIMVHMQQDLPELFDITFKTVAHQHWRCTHCERTGHLDEVSEAMEACPVPDYVIDRTRRQWLTSFTNADGQKHWC